MVEGKAGTGCRAGADCLLASFALRLRGAEVIGLDGVDSCPISPVLLKEIGGLYADGRQIAPEDLTKKHGKIELILEATGVAHLEFDLISALGINGIYVLTGIPEGDRPFDIDGPAVIRQLVLKNQLMLGSVNASRAHFQMAVDAMMNARRVWGDLIDRMITHRYPYSQFQKALSHHAADEIKTVIDWRLP